MAGEEGDGDWFVSAGGGVVEDGDWRGGCPPRCGDVKSSDGGKVGESLDTGAAYDGDVHRILQRIRNSSSRWIESGYFDSLQKVFLNSFDKQLDGRENPVFRYTTMPEIN